MIIHEIETWISSQTGAFSQADHHEISRIARAKAHQLVSSGVDPKSVLGILREDFARSSNWGFPRRQATPPSTFKTGLRLIAFVFVLFTFGLMSLAWLGQNYATSGESNDLYWLLAALGTILTVVCVFMVRAKSFLGRDR